MSDNSGNSRMKSQITEVIVEVPEMTEQKESLEKPQEILLEYSSNSGVEGAKNKTQIETGPRSMNFN